MRQLAPVLLSLLALAAPAAGGDGEDRFFESRIRPVLVDRCQSCHGAAKSKGGLRLDSRSAALAGGDSGPAVVPGNAEESLLLTAVGHGDDGLKMPPSGRLPQGQIDDLARWIASGAAWPETAAGPAPRNLKEVTAKDREHWSFRPVKRPTVPQVSDPAWVRNPIDAFVLAGLDAAGLKPAQEASRAVLIRRLSFDLTGLPPTPEEVAAFEADEAPDAYERLVDRLLASPAHGEAWARHWLDLVRYAETNSYERDDPKPNAWRYRDYVIRAFNDDRPYDRFIVEQLAGDELTDPTPDALVATGFYRLGIWDDEPTDRDQQRFDELDDIVATTGQVFLGLTLDCARCHDHKIDPIPQRDYYRMVAFFRNVEPYRNGGPTDEVPLFDSEADRTAHDAAARERETRRRTLTADLDALRAEFLQKYQPEIPGQTLSRRDLARAFEQHAERILGAPSLARAREIRKALDELRRDPSTPRALCVTESPGAPPETHMLARGSAHAPGDLVTPGYPEVLGAAEPVIPTPAPGSPTCGRRSVLAGWIASAENPLTARVMVNRLWQHHFGRGLVRSPSNFGVQGDPPTHPELLDWLATELVRQGWRLRPIHRLIVTSTAYRMAATPSPEALAKDPANDRLSHNDLRRLSAEELRDAILRTSGALNPAQGGPSVYPEIPREVLAGQSQPGKGWPTSGARDQARRSVYVHVKRSLLLPILDTFDLAETDRSTPARFATTQPGQALLLLNSGFVQEQAAVLAERLAREAGPELAAQVRRGYLLTVAREPTAGEIERARGLVAALEREPGSTPARARQGLALFLLNLNEFIFLD